MRTGRKFAFTKTGFKKTEALHLKITQTYGNGRSQTWVPFGKASGTTLICNRQHRTGMS